MRKNVCGVLACLMVVISLCGRADAANKTAMPPETYRQSTIMSVQATGSFRMSVSPYGKSEADKAFPLEAGETVSISAVYTPEDASMDFGLVDPNGVFHFFNVTDGSIDKTIQVNENGNYTFAVRNNSSQTVTVTGFVKY